MQQSPLGAEAALHTGNSLAVPPRLSTMVMAGGGTYGATGLIYLAPFTLQRAELLAAPADIESAPGTLICIGGNG